MVLYLRRSLKIYSSINIGSNLIARQGLAIKAQGMGRQLEAACQKRDLKGNRQAEVLKADTRRRALMVLSMKGLQMAAEQEQLMLSL